jgi:hypothetical protein
MHKSGVNRVGLVCVGSDTIAGAGARWCSGFTGNGIDIKPAAYDHKRNAAICAPLDHALRTSRNR